MTHPRQSNRKNLRVGHDDHERLAKLKKKQLFKEADIIFVVGDLTDENPQNVLDVLDPFDHPVLLVQGNHE